MKDSFPDCKNGCNAGAQFIATPETIHHGKMVCPNCGSFLGWVAKPENEKRRPSLEKAHKHFANGGIDYCQMCLRKRDELPPHVTLVAHHVIEDRDGGSAEPGNLWYICTICHEMIHLFRRNRQVREDRPTMAVPA